MLSFNGITPVMATPFRLDESIDFDALRKQIDFSIHAGAVGICGPGLGSEFYKLSDQERYAFVEEMAAYAKDRIPVIAATTGGSTRSTIELSRHAEKCGATCLMIMPPRSVALPAPEIANHYSRICDAVSIPVMLQDADFTGAGLPANVLVELARRHTNFRFAKLEVALPGTKCKQVIEESSGQIQVVYGLGALAMFDGLAHGATAMMPGAAALEVYVRVYRLYTDGRLAEAKLLFQRLMPYLTFALQHLEVAIQIEKRVMVARHILPDGRMRQPSMTLGEIYQSQMDGLVDSVVQLCDEVRGTSLHEAATVNQ